MKTIEDLKALLPTLLELFSQEDHEIGESYWEYDEDGRGRHNDYMPNCFIYDEDGWYVEVHYECCGVYHDDPGDYWTPPCEDLIRAWGKVSEINAYYYEEDTDEETEFSKEELKGFFAPFNKELEDIA